MLALVESGESDGCVVWHTDQLFRPRRDLETLIDGERDLAGPDDRFVLRIEVAELRGERIPLSRDRTDER